MSVIKMPVLALCLVAVMVLPVAVANPPVAVKAIALEQAAIQPERSAPAAVVSLSDSRIGAELNAPIMEIPVRVGEVIESGGVLVRLDCGDYELAVAELQARLAALEPRIRFARQQLQRVQALMKQQTVSQELVDQRESELAGLVAEREASRARLTMTERDLEKCTIRTPFKAAVLERLASVGEYATPGLPLVRVLDLEHLEVSADLIAEDARQFAGVENIVFRTGGRDYPVGLRAITPVIDPLTRTREVRLLFQGEKALPGAMGRLVWRGEAAVPADLLVRRNGGLGVLLAEDGKARFHPLPHAEEGRPATVNLPSEALIITEGRFVLNDGDVIDIVN